MSQHSWWCLALLLTGCTAQQNTLVFTPTTSSPAPRAVHSEPAQPRTTVPSLTRDSQSMPTRREVLDLIEERVRCGRFPERCNFARLAVPGSPYDEEVRALMKERMDFGLRTIAGNGAFRPTVTLIRMIDSAVAEVTTCIYDALVLYDTETIPGVHIVFNDRAISIFSTWSMHVHEGRWKWFSEVVTRYAIERDAC